MHVDLLPELALIPPGEFVMGAEDGDEDEKPAHRVHLHEFRMGVHPVTNAQYARFVQATGRRVPAIHELPLVVTAGGPERERAFRSAGTSYVWTDGCPPEGRENHPAVLVRWEDAATYCLWLSAATGRNVRLPSEAEWERAARGGVDGKQYPWGDRLDRDRANYLTDPATKSAHGTSECGSYPPNGFGLYDMVGNVWEWVRDWYDASYYSSSPRRNPSGPETGNLRLIRGGSWLSPDSRMLTCSYRHKVPPDTYSYGIGFRIVCTT